MKDFDVIVKVKGNPDYKINLNAEDEWKARTIAMMHYPYKLAGAFVDYVVTEHKEDKEAMQTKRKKWAYGKIFTGKAKEKK